MNTEQVAQRLRHSGSVFAEEEAQLLCGSFDGTVLSEAIEARCAGEPLEHILGWTMFAGVRIRVGPGVFVPRRRSEVLVHEALERLPRRGVLVELCCGAAPVATAVATARSGVRVFASDVDPAAVLVALDNLEPLGGRAGVGDLAQAVPLDLFGRVDVLVANAPYVPTREIGLMPHEAREHEPVRALDGGIDGLQVQRRVVQVAPRLLRPGGVLLVETARPMVDLTARLMSEVGLTTTVVLDELVDGTCVVGTLPG